MPRSQEYLKFDSIFKEALDSKGEIALPNVKEITDPAEALFKIVCSSRMAERPYFFRIRNFDPPRGKQTHETCWYPKIFQNTKGIGASFDGSGVILIADAGKTKTFSFQMCEHEWDESGANHSRGWHPKVCRKCGFDASIDSGD